MHSLPSFLQTARPLRTASLLLAAALCIATPLHTAGAADALTTSSSSSSSGKSTTTQLERSILGLPYGILKSVFSGVTKAAGNVVTKHVKKS